MLRACLFTFELVWVVGMFYLAKGCCLCVFHVVWHAFNLLKLRREVVDRSEAVTAFFATQALCELCDKCYVRIACKVEYLLLAYLQGYSLRT